METTSRNQKLQDHTRQLLNPHGEKLREAYLLQTRRHFHYKYWLHMMKFLFSWKHYNIDAHHTKPIQDASVLSPDYFNGGVNACHLLLRVSCAISMLNIKSTEHSKKICSWIISIYRAEKQMKNGPFANTHKIICQKPVQAGSKKATLICN